MAWVGLNCVEPVAISILGDMESRTSLPDSDSKRGNFAVHAALLFAVALVFAPVVLHPTDVIYSPRSDVLSQHHPFRTLQVESLHERGRPQLWNSTSFGGMPLVGDPQAGIFYPMNWLHALAPSDGSHAWFGWNIILHLILGGWGMLAWLKGHGFDLWARLAGAFTFSFAGKWLLHIAVPGHIIFLPLAWIPWQCFFIDRILRRPEPRDCIGFALVTAFAITGFHPQLLLYSQLLVLGYGLRGCILLWRSRDTRRVDASRLKAPLVLVGSGCLALVLCAAHLLPILDHMAYYVRGEGIPYSVAANYAITRELLQNLLLPEQGPLPNWEASIYLGIAALVLGGFALWHRPRRNALLYCLGSVIFCLWYATGGPGGLHRLMHDWLPGFSLFRFPNRMLLLIGFPLAYLVAAGTETLLRAPIRRGLAAAAITPAIAALVLVAIVQTNAALFTALALCLPGIALAIRAWGPAALAAPLLVFGLLIDQARYVIPLIHTMPIEEALGDHPLVSRLAAPLGHQRVLSINRRVRADLSPLPVTYITPAGIEGMRGFNPLVPVSTHRLLREGVGGMEPSRKTSTTVDSFPLRHRTPLDLFNIRWVISVAPIQLEGLVLRDRFPDLSVYLFELPRAMFEFNEVLLYENTRALPRAGLIPRARRVANQDQALEQLRSVDPRREVLIEDQDWTTIYPDPFRAIEVEHSGDRIRLDFDAGDGGYLLISELWYPGWRARVDGQIRELERANGFFLALEMGSGHHEVILEYWPGSLSVGLWISALGLVLLLALAGADQMLPTRRKARGIAPDKVVAP